MTLTTLFNINVVVFTVSGLLAGGLDCDLKDALKWLRSPKLVVPTLLWGWIVGPAVAWLIAQVLPLSVGVAAGLMLVSLSPIAPFHPLAASKARGDMSFSGSYVLLGTVLTVILMPVMAPYVIKGLTVNTWALAKPVIVLVLLPLLFGVAFKYYKPTAATKIFPWVKKLSAISMLTCIGMVLLMYGKQMIDTIGSFATGALVLFMVVMAVLPYLIGLGLKQNQRSVMALGMSSRNISAAFVAFFGITNPPEGMFVTVVLVVPLHVIVAFYSVAPIFGRLAGKTGEGAAVQMGTEKP